MLARWALQGKEVVELKDVNEYLVENGLCPADMPFLSTASGRIGLLAFQPRGDIIPSSEGLSVAAKTELSEQMASFLALAKEQNADFATCPEYSCPWDTIIECAQKEVFPREGALWSLGCESITAEQLVALESQLADAGVRAIRAPLVAGPGRFMNMLCHFFNTRDMHGNGVKVALLQAKTTPMGGTDFERDNLTCGQYIFRFGQAGANRLVCIICSDVLSADFRNHIVPQLQASTLVVHLQLNPDSAAPGFSDYRSRCCYMHPRTTEILCLNWAAGTRIKLGNQFEDWIVEPKSIFYRTTADIGGTDGEIIANHKKGCFLAYWEAMRTAAFLFHPDPAVFQLKISKPVMEGAAPGAKRTAPKMEARYEWTSAKWIQPANDADDKFIAYLTHHPESAPHLEPYIDRHIDLERLMQLSTGFTLEENSFEWMQLRSFRLAGDDTSSRLRLCWASAGGGAAHRSECQRRFKALALILDDPQKLPLRLAAFRGDTLRLTFESSPMFRKFRNLVVGDKRGTVVFLGADPDVAALTEVKEQLSKRLYDHNEDRQIISILYRDACGVLKDYMDSDAPPAINDDPRIDPVDIFNA